MRGRFEALSESRLLCSTAAGKPPGWIGWCEVLTVGAPSTSSEERLAAGHPVNTNLGRGGSAGEDGVPKGKGWVHIPSSCLLGPHTQLCVCVSWAEVIVLLGSMSPPCRVSVSGEKIGTLRRFAGPLPLGTGLGRWKGTCCGPHWDVGYGASVNWSRKLAKNMYLQRQRV